VLARTDEEALDERTQVARERASPIDFAFAERPARAAPLQVKDADGRALDDRNAEDGFDLRGLHARSVPEARVENRRRTDDGFPLGQGFLDDSSRHDLANELDLFVRAPRGAPPRGPFVRIEDLEVPLIGPENAHDETQGLVEERLGMLSIAETKKPDVEIALLSESFVVAVADVVRHGRPQSGYPEG